LDWPDRRLAILNDDILLGEALRQQGWSYRGVSLAGIVLGDAPSRRTA
jgi:hypothetical protein